MLLRIFILIILPFSAFSQKNTYKGFPSLIWPKLYDISFVKTSDDLGEFDKPIFTPAVKSMAGKTITLPGYMVPFDNGMKGSHFMVSSMPLNACFFCGVGGPQTVIEVFSKAPETFNEKPVEVRGVLRLNENDPEKMIYILEQAEIIGEVGM